MLITTAAPAASALRPARAPDSTPAPTPPVPSSSQEPRDIEGEIEALKESNLDYQILRKAFGIEDSSTSATSTRSKHATADPSDEAQDLQGTVTSLESGVSAQSMRVRIERNSQQVEQSSQSQRFSDISARHDQALNVELGVIMEGAPQVSDPLVLDLSGEGVSTTGLEAGVRFDLDGDGSEEQVSFVSGGTWALALDRNDNGRIDDGRELFGDQNGADNGFEELARLDDNRDGVLDAQDASFSRLRLLQIDADGTQRQQDLNEAGVTAIETGYQHVHKALNLYDQVAQSSTFQRQDGSRGEAHDVLLAHRTLA